MAMLARNMTIVMLTSTEMKLVVKCTIQESQIMATYALLDTQVALNMGVNQILLLCENFNALDFSTVIQINFFLISETSPEAGSMTWRRGCEVRGPKHDGCQEYKWDGGNITVVECVCSNELCNKNVPDIPTTTPGTFQNEPQFQIPYTK